MLKGGDMIDDIPGMLEDTPQGNKLLEKWCDQVFELQKQNL